VYQNSTILLFRPRTRNDPEGHQRKGFKQSGSSSMFTKAHEPTFRRAVKEAGLNHTSLNSQHKEHDSWVHQNEPEAATEKAKTL